MSKFKSKLARRIIAIALSGVMVMSSLTSSNISAYAAESASETANEAEETVTAAAEEDDVSDNDAETAAPSDKEDSEGKTDEVDTETVTIETTEDTVEADTKAEETKVVNGVDDVVETETKSPETDEPEVVESSTEEDTEVDVFEEETTEAEVSEEEVTEVESSEEEISEIEMTEDELQAAIETDAKGYLKGVTKNEDGKIDVYDFGGEELDPEKYNNIFVKDYIKTWAPATSGSTGRFDVGAVSGNDVLFKVDSVNTTTRVFFADTEIYDAVRANTNNSAEVYKIGLDENGAVSNTARVWMLKDKDSTSDALYDYSGYILFNGNTTKAKCVYVKLDEGDIVTLSVTTPGSASGEEITYSFFDSNDKLIDTQSFTTQVTETKNSAGDTVLYKTYAVDKVSFIAPKAGTYKLYPTKGQQKMTLARAEVKPAQTVKVSGKLTFPADFSSEDYGLKFVSAEGAEIEAAVDKANNTYEAELYGGIPVSYRPMLTGKMGDFYKVTAPETIEVNSDDVTADITVAELQKIEISGEIKGIPLEALQKAGENFKLTVSSTEIYIPQITITVGDEKATYTAEVEANVEYTIKEEGVNDYQLKSNKLKVNAAGTVDIEFVQKALYDVNVTVADGPVAAENVTKLIFINANEKDYSYVFDDITNVKLREGTYNVIAKAPGYKATETFSITVKETSETVQNNLTIAFEKTSTWTFSDDDFLADYITDNDYNGLTLKNVKVDIDSDDNTKTARMGATGEIKIPVETNCMVWVEFAYAASGRIGETDFAATTSASYLYDGGAGEVALTITEDPDDPDDVYINKIFITEPSMKITTFELDSTKFVPTGGDNTAIAQGTKLNTAVSDTTGLSNYEAGYFKLAGTVNQRVSSTTGATTAFELGKAETGYIQFIVTGTANATFNVASTGGSNTSLFSLIGNDGKYVADSEGKTVRAVSGTSATIIKYSNLPEGTYKLVATKDTDENKTAAGIATSTGINRATRMLKATVAQTWNGNFVMTDWSDVAAPVITDVVLVGPAQKDDKDKDVTDEYGNVIYKDEYPADTIAVKGSGLINEKTGAEKITAIMYDEAHNEVGREYVVANEVDGSFRIVLAPEKSGKYTFEVFMSREGEADKPAAAASQPKQFTLPLKQPTMRSATCLGEMADKPGYATIQIKWGEVKEADSYIISVDGNKYDKTFPITELQKDDEGFFVLDVKDLKIKEEKYKFTVTAVRTTVEQGYEESEASKEIEQRATSDAKQEWAFVRYGTSTKDANNYYSGDVYDNNLKIVAKSNGGKIVPLSTDGISFYYTTVSPDKNFELEATAVVDSWTYSNGQEGFGLMASDTIGIADDSDGAVWNNSYMVVATKIEYLWDGVKTYPSTAPSDTGDKINMYLGIGSIARTGATSTTLAEGETQPKNFKSESLTLENSCAQYGHGDYNIIGNMTNESAGKETKARIKEFKFKITKNNTGYWMTYTDKNGISRTNKYYDTTALNVIDPERVYVGMFTARNATVTFKDVKMTITNAADDAAPEDQPIVYSAPSYQVVSSNVTNTSDYDMIFNANWKGNISITDPNGNKVEITKEMIEEDFPVEGKKYVIEETVDGVTTKKEVSGYNAGRLTTDGELLPYCEENNLVDERFKIKLKLHNLTVGDNTYMITYSPDSTWRPQVYDAEQGKYVYDYYKELTTYETMTFPFTVNYRMYGEDGTTLYVANNGKVTGTGTYDNPLDIYTAVKYARPGQTIVLKEGVYKLNTPLAIDRGVSGLPSEKAKKDATAIDNGETFENYIKMVAENFTSREHPFDESESKVVLDFGGIASGMTIAGDYWYLKGFDVTNSSDGDKGIQVSGNYNVLDQINTYKNGNTGIQISRYKASDYTMADWPTGNSILNCTSYLNADAGYEDADGFAAKLTIGKYNVFDGCIAGYNADDGWDFFAKAESGPIGQVIIRNSVTFKNGYVLRNEKGELDINGATIVVAGNGNGFKMGGESITGYHGVWNCLSFYNRAKGIDSNSCPDIQAHNSISFNNESYNIAFYTNNAEKTDFESDHLISFKIAPLDEYGVASATAIADQLQPRGDQELDESKFKNSTSYFYASNKSTNITGKKVTTAWFKSLKFGGPSSITRNANGSINMNGFLELTENANKNMTDVGLGATATITPEGDYKNNVTSGEVNKNDKNDDSSSLIDTVTKDGLIIDATGTGFSVVLNDVDYDNAIGDTYNYQNINYYTYYTGVAFKPVVRVYYGGVELEKKNYSVSWKNNIKAYTAKPGDENFDEKKAPQLTITGKGNYQGTHTLYFTIRPYDISNNANTIKGYENQPNYLAAADITAVVGNTKKAVPKATFLGKNFNAVTGSVEKLVTNAETGAPVLDEDGNETYQSSDMSTAGKYRYALTPKDTLNFQGTRYVYVNVIEESANVKLMSNAKVKSIKQQIYLGRDTSGNRIGVELADSVFTDLVTIDRTTTLVKDKDYTVSYINNEEVGIATIVFTGTEGKVEGSTGAYYGSISANFRIAAKRFNATDYEVLITNSWGSTDPKVVPQVDYAGYAITPTVSVKVAETGRLLEYGYDYTYVVKNNTKPGTASVSVKGLGYYSGTVNKTFRIVLDRSKVLDLDTAVKAGTIKVGAVSAQDYVKGGVKPTPKLYLANGTTIDASNYSYSYKNNMKSNVEATVIIRGRSFLSGSTEINFKINPKNVSLMTTPSSDDLSVLYKDKNNNFMPYRLTVKDGKKLLSLNRDYDVQYYELVYAEEGGKKVVKETELTKGARLSTDSVHPTSLTDMKGEAYYTIKAVITGKGDYKGTKTITYRVVTGGDIRNAVIDRMEAEYYVTGGIVAPEPVVTAYAYNNGKYDRKTTTILKGGDNNGNFDYSLTYNKNDRAGMASVTVTGKNNYCGFKKVTFTIKKKSFNIKDAVLTNRDKKIVKDKDVLVITNLTEVEINDLKEQAVVKNEETGKKEYSEAEFNKLYNETLNSRLQDKLNEYLYMNGILLSSGTPELDKLDIEYIEPDYRIATATAKNLFTSGKTGTDTVIIQAVQKNTKGYSGTKKLTYTVVAPPSEEKPGEDDSIEESSATTESSSTSESNATTESSSTSESNATTESSSTSESNATTESSSTSESNATTESSSVESSDIESSSVESSGVESSSVESSSAEESSNVESSDVESSSVESSSAEESSSVESSDVESSSVESSSAEESSNVESSDVESSSIESSSAEESSSVESSDIESSNVESSSETENIGGGENLTTYAAPRTSITQWFKNLFSGLFN